MNLKLGIQTHSVREDFAADPQKTLKRLKEIGFEGVEIALSPASALPATFYKAALAEAGLACFGILVEWKDVQPDTLSATIAYAKEVGTDFIVIGSVPVPLVSTREDAMKAVDYMREVMKEVTPHGIAIGYHNHDSDFTSVVDGKPFFEYVFDGAPEDFIMLLDTGNAKAGGYDPEALLRKYPHRSPYLHIKGYSEKKKYLAYIGEDDLDWERIIDLAVSVGDSRVFNIEFGARADYVPFERAESGFRFVSEILKRK